MRIVCNRSNKVTICLLASFVLLSFYFLSFYSRRPASQIERRNDETREFNEEEIQTLMDTSAEVGTELIPTDDALSEAKRDVELSMMDYNYTSDLDLSTYLMEKGGQPVRNIIWTTFRSGSTFLGDAIASHPATFYHFEPLMYFQSGQVHGGPLAHEGLRVIKSLLECDYSDLEDYLEFGLEHIFQHTNNHRLWKYCEKDEDLCGDADFLSRMCGQFPFQVMKVVRMRLLLAEELLEDEKLDVRILFLVRDPRGVLHSRSKLNWCKGDCMNPSKLCGDMVEDYNAAEYFRQKYPNKVLMIRFEDISTNPFNGIKSMVDFLRLQYHPLVQEYLETHTGNKHGNSYSTFRDSKAVPFAWMDYYLLEKQRKKLENIQGECEEAMTLWGYNYVDAYEGKEQAQPLAQPPWPEMIIPLDQEG